MNMKKFVLRCLPKLCLAFLIVVVFLLSPLPTRSQVHADINPPNRNADETTDSDSACIPLDIIIAVDQGTRINGSDPDGMRIEAIKYLIKVLAENEKHICLDTTDNISVIYFGDTDKTTVQIGRTQISEVLIGNLQPMDLGNRDINAALTKIDLELTEGDSSRKENAKILVIIISDWLAAQCPDPNTCMPYLMQNKFVETQDLITRIVETHFSTPVFKVIGFPPVNPESNGYFSDNEELWNAMLGENGKFERFEKDKILLSEDLVLFVQENSQRNLYNNFCSTFTVPPFTEYYDVLIFADDPDSDVLPVFTTDTMNGVSAGSLSRTFIKENQSEGSRIDYFGLSDSGVGGMVKFPGSCERMVVFTQTLQKNASLYLKEDPVPKMYDEGNPIDEKYKMIFKYENSEDVNWDALCKAYDFKFDITIEDPDHMPVEWNSVFACEAEQQRFISKADMPNSKEGTYLVDVTAYAASSSIDSQQIFSFEGSYPVKLKNRIGFTVIEPEIGKDKVEYSVHGALFSDHWLKEQPLTFSVQLVNKETGDDVNPLSVNNNQPINSITATIVENDSALTAHEFNLVQSPSNPSMYSGTFSDFNPDVSEYNLYVSLPDNSYDQLLFSHDKLGIELERKDNLGTNPNTYYTIFILLFFGFSVWAFFFIKTFVNPLHGYLGFYMPGNLSAPIARIKLDPGHRRKKVLMESDLKKESPFLEGISKLDIDAVYQDGVLNAVNLQIHYPDMEVAQKEFLGAITIDYDPKTNQHNLGQPISESMTSAAKTKTGSLIVFTKE